MHQDMQERGLALYWNDKTCAVGGDEYNGLIESACFQRGKLSCLSCHSMHRSDPNDQLGDRMATNEACLQCHESLRGQLKEHTHHSANSSGSLCYNCHMPHTTYALLKAIRSHRVDIPSVAQSVRDRRPNACNLCHLDQTLQWTANALERWYGQAPVSLSGDEQLTAAGLLWLLKGNAMERVITAWHMSWEPATAVSGTDWEAPFLAELLTDSYSAVRFVAYRSLRKLPGFERLPYDFVGPEPQRTAAQKHVREFWSSQPPSDVIRPQLLLTTPRQTDQEQVQRLKEARDDSPSRLPE